MTTISELIKTALLFLVCGLLILIILGLIGVEIYVWVNYGGKPITEIPAWALWFMFSGGNK